MTTTETVLTIFLEHATLFTLTTLFLILRKFVDASSLYRKTQSEVSAEHCLR